MYVLDINPTILNIGSLKIQWYGLIYALGFILSYVFLRRVVKNRWIKRLDIEKLDSFIIYAILGVVLGSRLFYFVFYDFMELIVNPLEFFSIWHGGMSFHGGLIGTVVACILFSRKYKIDVWKLFDICTIPAIFALMLGRIGNLINGGLVGTAFDGGWCFIFPKYDMVCRHPYPIYAFISHLILFGYLVMLLYINREKIKSYLGKGVLGVNFLIGYGVLRIITDIWKVDNLVLGVKIGQWLSVIMILIGIIIIKEKKEKINIQ